MNAIYQLSAVYEDFQQLVNNYNRIIVTSMCNSDSGCLFHLVQHLKSRYNDLPSLTDDNHNCDLGIIQSMYYEISDPILTDLAREIDVGLTCFAESKSNCISSQDKCQWIKISRAADYLESVWLKMMLGMGSSPSPCNMKGLVLGFEEMSNQWSN